MSSLLRFGGTALAAILTLSFARIVHAADLPRRAASEAALQKSLSDAIRQEALPGGYLLLVPEPFAPPTPATDPLYRQRYSRALYVYEKDALGSLVQRVVLHFEPDDRDAATRSARLVARLLRLSHERFERDTTFPRGAPCADLWFAPSDKRDGGETRDANVYVFGTSAIQTPLELVRTIVHEWGHLTLPAARGYSEPESDAAGYLGERLFMKWLYEETLAKKRTLPDDGTTLATLAMYHGRQVAPLIARWQEGGPQSPTLTGVTTEAMDYYIGAGLAMDSALGSRVLGTTLFSIDDVRPTDFLSSAETVVAKEAAKPSGLVVTLPAWIPLGRGLYRVTALRGGGVVAFGTVATLRLADAKAKTDDALQVRTPGWKWTRATSGDLTAMVLKRPAESTASR